MIELARTTRKREANRYIAAREARVDRTWQRFRDTMWENGELIPDTDLLGKKLAIMRHMLRTSPPPGWTFLNMIEAEDIGSCDHLVDLASPEPTRAIPGTRAKLAVLAARAEAGQELWHEADAIDYET